MKIWYEAKDGTFFDNEDDCYSYEQKFEHTHLNTIIFFDEKGKEYTVGEDIFDDDVYQLANRVIIHNAEELSDFIWLSEECGWTEFFQITDVGEWIREEENWNGYWERIKK